MYLRIESVLYNRLTIMHMPGTVPKGKSYFIIDFKTLKSLCVEHFKRTSVTPVKRRVVVTIHADFCLGYLGNRKKEAAYAMRVVVHVEPGSEYGVVISAYPCFA